MSAVPVSVRYFAGAAAAAGVPEEKLETEPGTTVDGLLGQLRRHRPALAPVLAVATVLLDETPVRDRSVAVPDGATLDVLPPFAGG